VGELDLAEQTRCIADLLRQAGCLEPDDTAGRLMAEFSSIAGIMAAPPGLRSKVAGCAAAFLDLVAVVSGQTLRAAAIQSSTITNLAALADYLRHGLALQPREYVRVLFLRGENRLVGDEVLFGGNLDGCETSLRPLFHRALDLRANGLIIVHNHPSGDPTPSRSDIEMTRRVSEAGSMLGVALHDHIVVAAEGWRSMRAMGLL
jgi:DNA repair protein RadC